MLPKKNFKARECPVCGKLLSRKSYCSSKNPLFLEGCLPICGQCLSDFIVDEGGSWDVVDLVCQWANVPFRPDDFTRLYTANPNCAMEQYLELFSEGEYERMSWGEYEEKWKKAVAEGNEKELHPIFNLKEIEELQKRFGNCYGSDELYKLQGLYKGIEEAYGFGDVIAEDNAIKMAKISLEIDRAIANGDPIDKLITAYNKLQVQAGFTSDNARDVNSFESVGEIMVFLEKSGWTKKFHNDEQNDIVDATMRNVQAYNTRLWNNESTIVDQVEERFQQKKNIENMEERIEREDEAAFATPDDIVPIDDDDEVVDFEVDL